MLSVANIQEIMNKIGLMRDAVHFDNMNSVLVCDLQEIDAAIDFYKTKGTLPAEIYIFTEEKSVPKQYTGIKLQHIENLPKGSLPHVFFTPKAAPRLSTYRDISNWLQANYIYKYTVELISVQKFWGYGQTKTFSPEEWESIAYIYNTLKDDTSKHTFLAACKARIMGYPGYIPWSDYPQYEHPLVHTSVGDTVCEGGVDTGNTTLRLAELAAHSGVVHAFEPVQNSYTTCLKKFAPYKNIILQDKALWSCTGTINFYADPSSPNSAHVTAKSTNMVPCIAVDDYFKDIPLSCIKLDVEGAEMEVLQGSENVISRDHPKLLISIYHNGWRDLIAVPEYLMKKHPEYSFYCGHHSRWFSETMLYAIKAN